MKRIHLWLVCVIALGVCLSAKAQQVFLRSYWQNTIGTTNALSVAIWSGGNESSDPACSGKGVCLSQSAIGQMTSQVQVPPVLRPGDTITRLLSTNAPVTTDRAQPPAGWFGYTDDYLLQGVQGGEVVVIELASTDFDAFLEVRLLDDMTELAHDDNGGGGVGIGSLSRLVFTVPGSRACLVRVTSSSAGGIGYYNLRVQQSLAPQVWGFNPVMGVPGTVVRVWGTNFLDNGVSRITAVRIGGVQGPAGDAFVDETRQVVEVQVTENARSGPITVETFNGAASSLSNFMVLGRLGEVRQESGGGFSFGVTNGAGGLTNVVEATTDLRPPVVWQPVGTNPVQSPGVWRYTNQNSPAVLQRYFRTRVQ